MLMKLGNYTFELNTATYQKLSRRSRYHWEKLKRLDNKPAMQYVGNDADQIIIDGVVYPKFRGGLKQVDMMRSEAMKGSALPLVSGVGEILGEWVIKAIDESHEIFTKEGAPLKITFKLTLEEYSL